MINNKKLLTAATSAIAFLSITGAAYAATADTTAPTNNNAPNAAQQDHNPFANLDEATQAKVKAIMDQVKAGTLTQDEANTQLQALGVTMPEKQKQDPFANLDEATQAKAKAILEQVKAGTLTQDEANTQLQALGVTMPTNKPEHDNGNAGPNPNQTPNQTQNSNAATPPATNTGTIGVSINGEKVSMNTAPTLVNGSTFIPLRGVFEKLNASVEWDGTTSSAIVTSGTNEVKVTIGSNTAYVNGNAVALTTAPFIQNGSTFVPLRFISQSIGADVSWDGTNNMVNIKQN